MCGINGFLSSDARMIADMNALTRHRGPDGTAQFVGDGVSLGHNRLAIIDLDPRASQPMKTSDGRYVIVFNGEIYNYRELKRELSEYQFKTESDTEVILAGYIKWGNGVFARLNGMFALAIWDTSTRSLIVARDSVGIKPLYYFWDTSQFIFSSELRTIQSQVQGTLNQDALHMYLTLLYVPGPHTLLKNIYKLEPSTYAVVSSGTLEIHTYVPVKTTTDVSHNAASVRGTISSAVKSQLVSDRPVGVFLSGGFDSSIVLHHVMEHAGKAETFTTGFELPSDAHEEIEKFNSDLLLARKTAQFYGTTHHEQLISLEMVRSTFEDVLGAIDEPIANSALLPTYHLSKFAREHVVVALDGSGGDELFGGYNWYKINRMAEYFKSAPSFIQHAVLPLHPIFKKMIKSDAAYYLSFMGQEPKVLQSLLPHGDAFGETATYIRNRFYRDADTMTLTEKMMYIDEMMWLVDESLMRSDKMSMAHGLEIRVPLLDTTVVTMARHIPASEKVSFLKSKRSLRNAYWGFLPEYLYTQPKRGWFPPGAKWVRDPGIAEAMRAILSPHYYAPTKDLFAWSFVDQMLADHTSKKGYYFKPLWALVTFQIWARRNRVRL